MSSASPAPEGEAHWLHNHNRLIVTIRQEAQIADSSRAPKWLASGAAGSCVAGVLHPTGQVCCNATCGVCGGHGCSARPGGPNQCCMPAILRTRRTCHSPRDHACIVSTEDVTRTPSTRSASSAPVEPQRIPSQLLFVLFGGWQHLIAAGGATLVPANRTLVGSDMARLIDNTNSLLAANGGLERAVLLDDAACELSLRSLRLPDTLTAYRQEKDFRFKSDICRLGALYAVGGVYMDSDMVTHSPVFGILDPTTEFATVIGHGTGCWAGRSRTSSPSAPMPPAIEQFFNSFIASAPGNPIIRRAAELVPAFVRLRSLPLAHKRNITTGYCPWLLGPCTLLAAFRELHPELYRRLHTSPCAYNFGGGADGGARMQFFQEVDLLTDNADVEYAHCSHCCRAKNCQYAIVDPLSRPAKVVFFSRAWK